VSRYSVIIASTPKRLIDEKGRAVEDSFDSSDGFDASLDCSRELQGVVVGGVVND
jgi:hypothetical protein